LLHRRNALTLPNYECAESVGNDFDDIIQRIRTTLQSPHSGAIGRDIVCTDRPDTDCQLSSFMPVTREETVQLLSKSSCKFDPMISNLVKQCHDVMTVAIMKIINKCLMK